MTTLASAWVAIRPDLSGFGTALNRGVTQASTQAGQRSAAGMQRGLRGRMGAVGRMAGGALGVSLGVAAAGAFVKNSIGLEAQFSKTMNVLKATLPKADLEEMSDLAMKMGRDTVFSANDAGTAMLELAKGGMSAATIQAGALESSLTLAAAGGVSMENAATVMSQALNTFNLRGKQSGEVAAALAGAANASASSIDSLSMGLAQAGAQASQAGLSVQETTAALAAFSNAGVNGSDAGTSLKVFLQRLVPQTEKARDALMEYGLASNNAKAAEKAFAEEGIKGFSAFGDTDAILGKLREHFASALDLPITSDAVKKMADNFAWSNNILDSAFTDSKGNFEDLATMSGALSKALKNRSDEERTTALNTLFGSDASRAAAILMDEGRKGIEKYTKATSDRNAADRQAAATMKGTAGALETLSGSWETLQLSVGKALAPLVEFGARGLAEVINQVTVLIESFGGGSGDMERFGATFEAITDFGKSLLPTLTDIGDRVKAVVGPGLKEIGDLITGKLLPAFEDMLPVIQPIVNFILKMFGSAIVGMFKGAIRAIKGFVTFLSGVFKLVKAVLTGDWGAAWDAVKDILKGALDTIVGAFMVWFNFGIFSVFKNGIKMLLGSWRGLWTNVQKIGGVATKAIGSLIKNLWSKVIGPAMRGIGRVISVTFNKVVVPVFRAFWGFLTKVIIPIIKFLWRNVFTVAFKAIGAIVKFAWNFVVKPILKALWAYISKVLAPLFKWFWSKVVKPVFTWIGGLIRDSWQKVIKPVFEKLSKFIGERLVPAFRNGVARIGDIWKKLQRAAAVPVNFIIETVYNNGIRKLINALPGVDDLPKIAKVAFGAGAGGRGVPQSTGGGHDVIPAFDRGGWTGPGAKLDVAGIVHADEYVIRKASRRAIERDFPGLLDTLNGYASGGRVWPVPGHDTGTYPGHDGVDINRGSGWDDYGDPIRAAAAGIISYVGSGRGYGTAIFERGSYGELVYGHTSQTHVRAGERVNAGDLIGNVGNTGHSTAPHLHFGFPGGTTAQALAFLSGADVSGGGGGGGGGGVLHWLGKAWDSAKGALGAFGDKIGGWVSGVRDQPGWGGMLADMVGSVAGSVKDWVKSKIGGMFGGGSSAGSVAGIAPGGPVADTVRRVAETFGWGSGSQWSALSTLISHESGWNPGAQNPTSTAYGLFQFLDSTWGGVGGHKTSDARLQTLYGLRYIANRYNNPVGAWDFWQSHNWYDQGGIARGRGYMQKETLRPERVLSPRQTEDFGRLVDVLDRGGNLSSDRDRNLLAAAIYRAARDGIAERNASAYARMRVGV